MKKQWMVGIVISVLLLMGAGAIVYAQEPFNRDQTPLLPETKINNEVKTDLILPVSNDTCQVKFKGIWGYEGFNETSGYLGGVLVKRDRVVVLKGLWNTTDNIATGTIVGIVKRGYFNGRILIQNQTKCQIVGLYRYDTEQKLLHFRWMTIQQTGWAHCRIVVY